MKQSEEFFRTLHTHHGGIPLDTINGISIPSSGMIDTILAIIHRRCSPFLTVAFFAGLLSIATSTLTPAVRKFIGYLSDSVIEHPYIAYASSIRRYPLG